MVDLTSVGSQALNIFIIIFIAVSAIAIIGGLVWLYMMYRKYSQYTCIIFERDGFGQFSEKRDMAGIFVDRKTKNKRFYMRKYKVGLNPDNVPYIQSGKKRVVYLYRTGLTNFHFININIKHPDVTMTVGEEDVNWAVNAYERSKKIFNQSMWMQIIPFIGLVFVCIAIIVVFIYFFQDFETLYQMAEAMKEAAKQISQAYSGTTVIGG